MWSFHEDGDANHYAIIDENGDWIISLLLNGKAYTQEQRAIMHLICAAPAMRDALQRIIANIDRWLETGIPSDTVESKAIYDQLVAAVEKSLGKPKISS